jgi:hypothetical protein
MDAAFFYRLASQCRAMLPCANSADVRDQLEMWIREFEAPPSAWADGINTAADPPRGGDGGDA